jgi:adenylate kinase family enzyme/YHS domain-containing protein
MSLKSLFNAKFNLDDNKLDELASTQDLSGNSKDNNEVSDVGTVAAKGDINQLFSDPRVANKPNQTLYRPNANNTNNTSTTATPLKPTPPVVPKPAEYEEKTAVHRRPISANKAAKLTPIKRSLVSPAAKARLAPNVILSPHAPYIPQLLSDSAALIEAVELETQPAQAKKFPPVKPYAGDITDVQTLKQYSAAQTEMQQAFSAEYKELFDLHYSQEKLCSKDLLLPKTALSLKFTMENWNKRRFNEEKVNIHSTSTSSDELDRYNLIQNDLLGTTVKLSLENPLSVLIFGSDAQQNNAIATELAKRLGLVHVNWDYCLEFARTHANQITHSIITKLNSGESINESQLLQLLLNTLHNSTVLSTRGYVMQWLQLGQQQISSLFADTLLQQKKVWPPNFLYTLSSAQPQSKQEQSKLQEISGYLEIQKQLLDEAEETQPEAAAGEDKASLAAAEIKAAEAANSNPINPADALAASTPPITISVTQPEEFTAAENSSLPSDSAAAQPSVQPFPAPFLHSQPLSVIFPSNIHDFSSEIKAFSAGLAAISAAKERQIISLDSAASLEKIVQTIEYSLGSNKLRAEAHKIVADSEDYIFPASNPSTWADFRPEIHSHLELESSEQQQLLVPQFYSIFQRFCPVSLVDEHKLAAGSDLFEANYLGLAYVFADEGKLKKFLENPEVYVNAPAVLPKNYIILLLGCTGSGKSSLAKVLSQHFNFTILSTHELLQLKQQQGDLSGQIIIDEPASARPAAQIETLLQNHIAIDSVLYLYVDEVEILPGRVRAAANPATANADSTDAALNSPSASNTVLSPAKGKKEKKVVNEAEELLMDGAFEYQDDSWPKLQALLSRNTIPFHSLNSSANSVEELSETSRPLIDPFFAFRLQLQPQILSENRQKAQEKSDFLMKYSPGSAVLKFHQTNFCAPCFFESKLYVPAINPELCVVYHNNSYLCCSEVCIEKFLRHPSRYNLNHRKLQSNISLLQAIPGLRILLLGARGSGKSTYASVIQAKFNLGNHFALSAEFYPRFIALCRHILSNLNEAEQNNSTAAAEDTDELNSARSNTNQQKHLLSEFLVNPAPNEAVVLELIEAGSIGQEHIEFILDEIFRSKLNSAYIAEVDICLPIIYQSLLALFQQLSARQLLPSFICTVDTSAHIAISRLVNREYSSLTTGGKTSLGLDLNEFRAKKAAAEAAEAEKRAAAAEAEKKQRTRERAKARRAKKLAKQREVKELKDRGIDIDDSLSDAGTEITSVTFYNAKNAALAVQDDDKSDTASLKNESIHSLGTQNIAAAGTAPLLEAKTAEELAAEEHEKQVRSELHAICSELYKSSGDSVEAALKLFAAAGFVVLEDPALDGELPVRALINSVNATFQPFLTAQAALFNAIYEISHSDAKKLLRTGNKCLTDNGFYCPACIEQCENSYSVGSLLPFPYYQKDYAESDVQPLLWLNYIIYPCSAQHSATIQSSYVKYFSPKYSLRSPLPLHIAVYSNNPDDKYNQLVQGIAKQHNLIYTNVQQLLKEFLNEFDSENSLVQKIKAKLLANEPLSNDLLLAAVAAVLKSGELRQQGYILDSFPETSEQAQLLKLFNINIDQVIVYNNSNLNTIGNNNYANIIDELMNMATEQAEEGSADHADAAAQKQQQVTDIFSSILSLKETSVPRHLDSLLAFYSYNYSAVLQLTSNESNWILSERVEKEINEIRKFKDKYERDISAKNGAGAVGPASVHRQNISRDYFFTHSSSLLQYCPVCLKNSGELAVTDLNSTYSLENAVEYKNSFYSCCSDAHAHDFLTNPDEFSAVALPQELPFIVDPGLNSSIEHENCALLGFDSVVLRENAASGQSKVILGSESSTVSYRGSLYRFSSAANQQKFLRTPENYISVKLPQKPLIALHASIPAATDFLRFNLSLAYLEHEFQAIIIKSLNELVATERGESKEENSGLPTAIYANRILKYPGLSLAQSSALFISLFLRTHNMRSKEWLREKYNNKLHQFLDHAALIQSIRQDNNHHRAAEYNNIVAATSSSNKQDLINYFQKFLK